MTTHQKSPIEGTIADRRALFVTYQADLVATAPHPDLDYGAWILSKYTSKPFQDSYIILNTANVSSGPPLTLLSDVPLSYANAFAGERGGAGYGIGVTSMGPFK